MDKVIVVILTLLSLNLYSQKDPNKLARHIVEEGKRLYRSEMASWYGTDVFLAVYKNQENIGGYFSYTVNDTSHCIFFSKEEHPKVIGTISFDSTYDINNVNLDLTKRTFTSPEKALFDIRQRALALIQVDTFFKTYEHTNLNLIPMIHNREKKVYVLTGPQEDGVVIFGNDYLITFDDENKIVEKKRLHKNIISIEYGSEENEDPNQQVVGTIHSHLPETGPFITATDVCTLMLYCKYTGWQYHNVVSDKYLNIWNCQTNELKVIPKETFKKIVQDQEERQKEDGGN